MSRSKRECMIHGIVPTPKVPIYDPLKLKEGDRVILYDKTTQENEHGQRVVKTTESRYIFIRKNRYNVYFFWDAAGFITSFGDVELRQKMTPPIKIWRGGVIHN